MDSLTLSLRRIGLYGLMWVAATLGLAVVLSWVLLPGYDLYGLFLPAVRDVWAGRFTYAAWPLFTNPPWALVLMLPLGLLTPPLAHGLIVAVTIVVVYRVMRGYRRMKVSFPLAVISTPLIALAWVGQLEAFSLLGAILGFEAVQQKRPWTLAGALLLLSIKPQETWLVAILLVVSARHWPWKTWASILAAIGIVAVGSSLWLGADWISRISNGPSYVGGWQNFSLWQWATVAPPWLIGLIGLVLAVGVAWGLWRSGSTRSGLALAAVGSNLLSPYLTAPHLLMTLCLGWGELFDRSRTWGLVAYSFSLLPLIRLIWPDQSLNRLDLLFPLVVFVGLIIQARSITRAPS